MVVSHDFLFRSKASATLSLSGIMFDSARSGDSAGRLCRLDVVGRSLQDNPKLVIELGGYSDGLEEGGYHSDGSWTLAEARGFGSPEIPDGQVRHRPVATRIQGYADLPRPGDNSTPEGREQEPPGRVVRYQGIAGATA